MRSSKRNAISPGPFDFFDNRADGFFLIGRKIRLFFFGVEREEVDDGMIFEVKVNHARPTALAPAGEPHPHFADAARSFDEVAFLRVVLQLVLEGAVCLIVDQRADSFGEAA